MRFATTTTPEGAVLQYPIERDKKGQPTIGDLRQIRPPIIRNPGELFGRYKRVSLEFGAALSEIMHGILAN